MIPLFKSHYSLGRSILTLEKAGNSKSNGPDSIVDIAVENKLSNVVLVEDSLSGFIEAYKNLSAEKIKLIFGLRITCVNDYTQKNEESLKTEHKIIIFAKSQSGWKKLIKIWSKAANEGKYYVPRTDLNMVNSIWDDNDLLLAIPFYDSFIFKNLMTFSTCVPDFRKIKPIFFCEDNRLPFDKMVKEKVLEYASSNNAQIENAQSVFYKRRKDFQSYLTFRCINNRSTLEKPELEHMCSDGFCFESFLEKNA